MYVSLIYVWNLSDTPDLTKHEHTNFFTEHTYVCILLKLKLIDTHAGGDLNPGELYTHLHLKYTCPLYKFGIYQRHQTSRDIHTVGDLKPGELYTRLHIVIWPRANFTTELPHSCCVPPATASPMESRSGPQRGDGVRSHL